MCTRSQKSIIVLPLIEYFFQNKDSCSEKNQAHLLPQLLLEIHVFMMSKISKSERRRSTASKLHKNNDIVNNHRVGHSGCRDKLKDICQLMLSTRDKMIVS